MITIKLKLQNKIDIKEIQHQFNCVVRYAYNRFHEEKKNKEIEKLVTSLNNIELLDTGFTRSAILKAEYLFKSNPDKKIIFGGKYNFKQRSQNKITKNDFNKNKLLPLTVTGSKHDAGNRKFKLDIIQNNQIVFKINVRNHITLQLPKLSKNQKELLFKIQECAENKSQPVTVSLDENYVYLCFDESIIKKETYKPKLGRILSLDMNPNYIGISICDYDEEQNQTIIHKQIISNKEINDINTKSLPSTDKLKKYQTNKRTHETYEIVKYIVNLCKTYHVDYLTHEDLNISSKDNQKGRNYNRLVNNFWQRNKFINNLHKLCNINCIKYESILANYSSFIGCINYQNDIDSVAASLEINRRSNLFIKMYRTKEIKTGNVMFPKLNKKLILNRWKEDGLTDKDLSDWKTLYSWFKKNTKLSYRVLFNNSNIIKSFRLKSYKSKVACHLIDTK